MIKITKLKEAENPRFGSASSVEEYRASLDAEENLSPNIDYWIIGEPINKLKVGESFEVARFVRNGIRVPGLFQTSRVKKITENGFETENSVYLIEEVNE